MASADDCPPIETIVIEPLATEFICMEENLVNINTEQNGELSLDGFHILSFDAVIKTWYRARHRYQIAPSERTQSDYEVATNELGLAFSEWSTQLPELVEQFAFWFRSHELTSTR